MPNPAHLRTFAATAFGAIALAGVAGGGAAIATTPTPSPTPPTPLGTPMSTPFFTQPECNDVLPAGWRNRPANLNAVPNAEGTRVTLDWEVGAGPPPSGPCFQVPMHWRVSVDGQQVADTTTELGGRTAVSGFAPGETHEFSVEGLNNVIGPLKRTITIAADTCTDVPTDTTRFPKLAPNPPVSFENTFGMAHLSWTAPAGGCPIVTYRISDARGIREQPASAGTSGIGYGPPGIWDAGGSAWVEAIDAAGNAWRSNSVSYSFGPPTPSPAPPTPTPSPVATQAFTVAGSTTLRAKNASGTFRLAGTASLTPRVGASGGPIQLAPTTATLLIGGVFPAQAKLTFGPGELSLPVTATPSATFTAPLTITKATLFGLVLTQGGTCRTLKPITATLVPAGAFGITSGGTLTGSYTPGGFGGCASLGGFLGATGTKSPIALTLTPTAPATS